MMQEAAVDLENYISQNIILPDKITKKSNEFTTLLICSILGFYFIKNNRNGSITSTAHIIKIHLTTN